MTPKKKYKLLYRIKNLLSCEWDDITKLSDEQLAYINWYLPHSSFLEACPGSGKTEVIGIKAAYEIKRWKQNNAGIAVVTFTTSAAKELKSRVRKFGGDTPDIFPHFIGTFDSWVHNYILQPFSHYLTGFVGKEGDKSIRMIDSDSSASFLATYTTNIGTGRALQPVKVTEYYYDFNKTLHGINDKVDGIFNRGLSAAEIQMLKTNKSNFIRAGFATYADTDALCNMLLAKFPILKKRLSQRFPALVIDECQDLSLGQLNILESLRVEGSSLHFVGDLHQSIYEFRKVNPIDTETYIRTNNLAVLKLTNNYRSCQSIVTACENIIGGNPAIIGHADLLCTPSCILWQYDDATFPLLPEKFASILSQNNLEIKKAAILARGKSTLSPLRNQSENYGKDKVELMALALHCWYKPMRTTSEMESALFYTGRLLCLLCYGGKGNSRNQYCPEESDPITWRLFLKKFLTDTISLYPFTSNGTDLTWNTWIPALKTCLQARWSGYSFAVTWDQVKTKLKSPNGRTTEAVNVICSSKGLKNIFRTTTIHSVKGETMSAVLLVSHHNRQSKGGHFSQWLQIGAFDPEHIRFAYVACSRPKYLLIMATPQLNHTEMTNLTNLGFTSQPLPI